MQREIRLTADGSSTLFVAELNEHYHSTHGAFQESMHVFIDAGFRTQPTSKFLVLEIGFGTGLNAWLTAIEAEKSDKTISYVGIEKFPLQKDEVAALNYPSFISDKKSQTLFDKIHQATYGENVAISSHFNLLKLQKDFLDIKDVAAFDLIYFDAFAPEKQPELWTESMFAKMFAALKPGGFLVTYCAKGQVKRTMKSVGFVVEALPGPPGKREMTKATKAI